MKDSRFKLLARRAVASSPYRFASALGLTPDRLVLGLSGLPAFFSDLRRYRSATPDGSTFSVRSSSFYPCLSDRFDSGGIARGHYFHQDLWVARRIFDAAPKTHWDVGSRVDGFIAHLLSFRQVGVVDLRPLPSSLPGLSFRQGDITELPFETASLESLSCLHVVEHVGLGRYGDRVDPAGHVVAMRELERAVAPGGRLYFSVPIGRERVEFNAHRVFNPATIETQFKSMKLEAFAAIDDAGDLSDPAIPGAFGDAQFSCGLFVFRKASSLP